MRRKPVGVYALLGAAVAIVALVVPAAASALTDFTWTGNGATQVWSDAGNWSGVAAPSGAVGTLTFPPRSVCAYCTVYSSDDVPGISADGVSIDDSTPYAISGLQTLTIGVGGVSAVPMSHSGGTAGLGPELALSAPQTWTIAGDGANARAGLSLGTVSGGGNALTVELSNSARLTARDVETGPLTLSGSGSLTSFFPSLNATDGNPVIVSGGASLVVQGGGAVGPLHLTGGALSLLGAFGGPPVSAGTLALTGGLSMDAASSMTLQIGLVGPVGIGGYVDDLPKITATGPVDLGGARLTLLPADACPIFSAGQTYTLLTTTGSLTGQFSGIPDGATVPVNSSCPGPPQTMRINYTATSVIATVISPGPAPTSVSVLSDPLSAVTNQPVTLTATVTASYGTPSGAVGFTDFTDNGAAIAGCSQRAVVSHGLSGTATCRTSFAAATGSEDHHYLVVTYTPSDPAGTRESTNTYHGFVFGSIAVTPATTSTRMTASRPTVATGRSVTYTATVIPAYPGGVTPLGTIQFTDRGVAIPACLRRPLARTGVTARATCTVSYQARGTHTVTARWAGDANFRASTSGPVRVESWSRAALAAQLRPTGTAASIRRLVARGKITQRIRLSIACRLTVSWVAVVSTRGRRRRIVLTTGSITYAAAGARMLTMTLTSAGRRALAHARRIRTTATARIAGPHAAPEVVTTTFLLRR